MRVHFIAIGGSAMHNLAIALHKKSYQITGSDDEIFEPSRTRLASLGLLPPQSGWFPEKITTNLDAVILGMHARKDNPELLKAQELGIKIYSYPEYLYEQSKDKIRIVIGGSHGKTTITAMILHVFNKCSIDTDYMVGAKLDGFEVMVKLSVDAKYMVIEGDEYLTSPIDLRPKFHLYRPNIALLSGIAWDHINVFPTFDIYVDQFRKFIQLIENEGSLIYSHDDEELKKLVKESFNNSIAIVPYTKPEYVINEFGQTQIIWNGIKTSLKIFGDHNLCNLMGAFEVCKAVGISESDFFHTISSFKGASNRLELIAESDSTKVYKDFAHSPSKLKATTQAVTRQFKNHSLIACMELHTFSSLNSDFLAQYKDSMKEPDVAIVYFNPHTIEHKKLKAISEEEVKQAFGRSDLMVFTNSNALQEFLLSQNYTSKNLLLMSSGNFDGVDLKAFAEKIVSKKD